VLGPCNPHPPFLPTEALNVEDFGIALGIVPPGGSYDLSVWEPWEVAGPINGTETPMLSRGRVSHESNEIPRIL